MNAMKKILAFALAGVMALALLTGCGTGSSASHKSIAKAMADYDNGQHLKTTITCTSSAVLDAKLQEQAKKPGFEDVVKNVTRVHLHLSLSRPIVISLVRSSTSTAASTTRMPESRPST